MRTLCAAVVAVLTAGAASQVPTDAELLSRAAAAFDRGVELRDEDPAASAASLDEAIAAFRELAGPRGVRNALLERNIGNAYLLAGDLGRAVLHFRRAEDISPHDVRVRESLAAARARVRREVTPSLAERSIDAVFFWRGFVPRSWLLWAGIACWVAGWGAAAARRAAGRHGLAGTAVALGAGVLLLASVAAERWLTVNAAAVVVVADETTARRGPSESVYEPAFDIPLTAGVEGTRLEARDGWWRIRLASGREAWLPPETAALVRPARDNQDG